MRRRGARESAIIQLMSDMTIDAAALRLMIGQHSYARTRQLRELGFSQDQINHRVDAGVYERITRGLLALPDRTDTPASLAMRAVLTVSCEVAAARSTAARLHGLEIPRPDGEPETDDEQAPENIELHVVALDRKQRSRTCGNVRIHRTRHLPEEHLTTVEEVPVTSLARTIADCAVGLDQWSALHMVDSVALTKSERRRVHRTCAELSNGRAGIRAIVVVTASDGEQRFRSVLERTAYAVLAAHHIPAGEWNVAIHDTRGRVREVDLCYRSEALIVEFDGLRFHRSGSAAQRDRSTDRRLVTAGWRVLRFTWQDVVHRPTKMVDDIRTALHRPGGLPVGSRGVA